jgi:hypothetical protein
MANTLTIEDPRLDSPVPSREYDHLDIGMLQQDACCWDDHPCSLSAAPNERSKSVAAQAKLG